MKREVVAVVTALSLVLAVSAFAIEGAQPSKETILNIEQKKADYLKQIDAQINRLQQKKTCIEAAKNQDDLNACFMANMKGQPDVMRMKGGPGVKGSEMPPQAK